jgi:putative transposase
MKITTTAPNYRGFRFPSEIISHAVWLYFRFSLSFRDVEELLAQRGIVVTSETVRQWCLKFGQTSANELRRRRPRCGDKWHAGRASSSRSVAKDTLCGERWIKREMYWIYASQSRRNKHAAKRFFRKLRVRLQ